MIRPWTRPGAEPWWTCACNRNPLAVGVYCPTCSTRLTDSYGVVHECPPCERSAA